MKKGCGMKMAKGGSVKKMSPRKAMAMGQKPSGSKSGVKKYALGGMVMGSPYPGLVNDIKRVVPRPGMAGGPSAPQTATRTITIGAGPASGQTFTRTAAPRSGITFTKQGRAIPLPRSPQRRV